MAETQTTLDLRGLSCPVPLMRTRRQLLTLSAGQRIVVLTTDPDSKADLMAFCDGRMSRVITYEEQDGQFSFLIERC